MLTLFNTRSNSLDLFNPKFEEIGIYTCGPTVYNLAHIGNLKTFFWSDFIVSVIEYLYPNRVKAIMNITDIDDKILSRLSEQTLDELLKYTKYYTQKFFEDMTSLNITRYHNNYHTVTDNIIQMEQFINKLIENNYAYQVPSGSIYFDSSKIDQYPFPTIKKEHINSDYEGRKIIREQGIKDSKDFTLWKVKDNEYISWKMPTLSMGRCGWHLECSCIALTYLSNVTIHVGGEDLKMPHHTCEILQSEAHDNSKQFGKYWSHIGFLNINQEKMSKSIGNVLYLKDINENKFLLRYYFFTKHYRNLFEFALDDMSSHKVHFLTIHNLYSKLKHETIRYSNNNNKCQIDNVFETIMKYVLNDFNTPDAIKELIKFVNKYVGNQVSKEQADEIINQLDKINNIFKLIDKDLVAIPIEILEKLKQREIFRQAKQYMDADNIRKEIPDNYAINDYNHGVSIIKKLNN